MRPFPSIRELVRTLRVSASRSSQATRRLRPDSPIQPTGLESRELLSSNPTFAPLQTGDQLWQRVEALPEARGQVSYLSASKFVGTSLNQEAMRTQLAGAPAEVNGVAPASPKTITLADPNGQLQRFAVYESSVMAPELAAQFPEIKTYAGRGIDDPTATVRFDLTPQGFHAQVFSANGRWYIDPYFHNSPSLSASYYAADMRAGTNSTDSLRGSLGGVESDIRRSPGPVARPATQIGTANRSGTQLRSYRIAVAATGEYTAFHGGTVALGQAAIVTAMNRVNQVYEQEFSIRMNLVANNSSLVYTNATSDPYTNDDGLAMLDQNQANVDTIIGNANYDIGHVFSTGGGGIAGLGVVGNSLRKAEGVTGRGAPIGDAFTIDYVAHEIGHQFNAEHTFNVSDSNRNASTAYEPGSGSTIMAYAGLFGINDLQPNSDPYFHSVSFDEVINFVDNIIPTVGTRTATGNSIPTVNAGNNFTIPAATPFTLTAVGADTNGTASLTYNWEQRDLGPAQALADPDNGSSPLFRSFNPTSSPSRTFPKLSDILGGTTTPGEKLPTTTRTMNFRATVRDNNAGGGGVNTDDMVVNVVNTGSPFRVLTGNSATTLTGGGSQTITWDVAGTNANGINTANVQILLSTDGGLTFGTVLASTEANDGSALVAIPNINSSQARIKVQAVGNVFFDINDVNLTITQGTAGPEISAADGLVDIVDGSSTVAFGSIPQGATGASRTFVVSNNGTTNLVLQPASFTSGSGFTITTNFTAGQVVAPGASTSLVVRLDSASIGAKTAAISFVNNDSDENPFNFALTGTVTDASNASIAGKVFNDLDGDGVIDAGETGISGRTVYLDANNNGALDGSGSVSGSVSSTNVPLAIPELGTVTSTLSVAGLAGTISDLNVTLSLTHTFDGDLTLTLIAPNGTEVILSQNRGGGGDNYTGATFDDEATTLISAGVAPFTGSFRPESPLSVLDGLNPNGTWTLKIVDSASGDFGELVSWSLGLTRTTPGEASTTTNASGDYTLGTLLAGTYNVRQVLPSGWVQTTPTSNAAHVVNLTAGQTVTGRQFGTRLSAPSNVTIVDDGSSEFTQTGNWIITTGSGREGDRRYVAAGNGTATATWSFAGQSSGRYRVSVNYLASSNRATNAAYTISQTGVVTPLLTAAINQRNTPNSLTANGSIWQDLGTVDLMTNGTLVVRLANTTTGIVEADGVRIERIGSAPIIIDDGGAGFAQTGTWINVSGSGRDGDRRYTAVGNASSTASWSLNGLGSGRYRVSVNYTAATNRANNAAYTISQSAGGTPLLTMAINQRVAPASFTANGTAWQDLGQVNLFADGNLVVRLANTTSGIVEADAVRIERIGNASATIIDDGAAGYNQTGSWINVAGSGRDGDRRYAVTGNATATATWSFSGLAAGTYRVVANYVANANRASDAAYQIQGGAAPQNSTINQRFAPGSLTADGTTWQDVGTVTLVGNTLVVRLSNTLSGFVEADAIRIERIG